MCSGQTDREERAGGVSLDFVQGKKPPLQIDGDYCKGGSREKARARRRSAESEEVGGGAGGIPFAERDCAVPAFVHGLLKRLEGLGGVLGFVALEGTLELLFILLGIGDVDGEVGRIEGVKLQGGGPDGVESLSLGGREAGIVELDVGVHRLDDLRDSVGDKAMIGMAVAAIGSPSEDDLRMKFVDEFLDVVGDGVNVLGEGIGHGAEFAVIEIEEEGRLDAELLAGAGGFGAASGGERLASGNLGEIVDAFFAFSGDGEVDLDTFPGVAGEDRAHEGLVVGMSGDGEEDARWLLREQRKGKQEKHGDERGIFHGWDPLGSELLRKQYHHFMGASG